MPLSPRFLLCICEVPLAIFRSAGSVVVLSPYDVGVLFARRRVFATGRNASREHHVLFSSVRPLTLEEKFASWRTDTTLWLFRHSLGIRILGAWRAGDVHSMHDVLRALGLLFRIPGSRAV
jgi:hypothetical protein